MLIKYKISENWRKSA